MDSIISMAKKINTRRKDLGVSQEELASRLGVSRPTLVKIEKGVRSLTTVEQEKLEEIFLSLEGHVISSDVRIAVPQQNIAKFQAVILYLLDKVGAKPNVGLTVIYKLLYFIDFDYYEKYEQQLMGLTYIKNTHGPTPREFTSIIRLMEKQGDIEPIRSSHFKYEQKKYLPRRSPDLSLLSGQELELIDDVLTRYADKSAATLSDMSHRDTPWKATEDGKDIDYELAFYRPDEFSVRDYGEL